MLLAVVSEGKFCITATPFFISALITGMEYTWLFITNTTTFPTLLFVSLDHSLVPSAVKRITTELPKALVFLIWELSITGFGLIAKTA